MSEFAAVVAGHEDIHDMYDLIWNRGRNIAKERVDVSKIKAPMNERLKDLLSIQTNDTWLDHLNKLQAKKDKFDGHGFKLVYEEDGAVDLQEARDHGKAKRVQRRRNVADRKKRDAQFKKAVKKTHKIDKLFHYK